MCHRTRAILLLLLTTCCWLGCAYHAGFSTKKLPGGYTQVAVPVFRNSTSQVGVEMPFTNGMIRELANSKVAQVVDPEIAPVSLEGTVNKVDLVQGGALKAGEGSLLPDQTALVTEYRILMRVTLILKRKSDQRILWQTVVENEKVYQAPRILGPVVNSANANYNHSVRQETIALLAGEMMTEAHDRLTESF